MIYFQVLATLAFVVFLFLAWLFLQAVKNQASIGRRYDAHLTNIEGELDRIGSRIMELEQ